MRLKPKHAWFLAFTAVFAALAGFVFWGTWSTSCAPVMPDCPVSHPPHWFSDWVRGWLSSGKFVPGDVRVFIGNPYFWQELNYALALYFSALGAVYFLCGRGLSRLASYGAALLLAFSGYWCSLFSAGHLGWFQWMTYGVFAFGLADRAIRKNKTKNWVLLGATLAWGSFYQPDLWLLFSVFTFAYFVHACVRERRLPAWKGMALAAAAFFLIGAPSFYNAIFKDLAGRDKQIYEGETVAGNVVDEDEKRWIFTTNWSLPPAETAEFFIPRLNGDTSCPMTLSIGMQRGTGIKPYTGALGRPKDAPAGNYRQHSLYIGFVTCLLALAGVALGWRKTLFFAVAAVVFWLFSMGRYCEIVYRCVYALPFGDYLRAPVKWHHLTEFSVVILAAYGIDALLKKLSAAEKFRKAAPFVLGSLVLVGAVDLARVDRLFCSPVDLAESRRQNCSFRMTFLRRADFSNPQVASMVKAKHIVPLANPNPETYLVGVLQPWGRKPAENPPFSLPSALGVLSILATVGVAVFCVFSFSRAYVPR